MLDKVSDKWFWNGWDISWSMSNPKDTEPKINILLIHGFGASKKHWRNNQDFLAEFSNCYAIDLLGFGESSQPSASLDHEHSKQNSVKYCFDLWGTQVAEFCNEKVSSPVYLIGNSIGGIVALKAAQILKEKCEGVILIDCAQRTMDDKRIKKNDIITNFLRPILKTLVRQKFISNSLFKRASNRKIIKQILYKAYPSKRNIDEDLIEILYEPSQRKNSAEAFRGFINLFDDYLPTDLLEIVSNPIDLIWGEEDPWESLSEAQDWKKRYKNIRSLKVIKGAGHCPHDEKPEEVNQLILDIIQDTK